MPRRSGSFGIVAAAAAVLAFGTSLLSPVGPAGADPAEADPTKGAQRLSRRGPLAGRPARPDRDRARAQPGLEARSVRPTRHARGLHRGRRGMAGGARLQRRPDRHPVGGRDPGRARRGRPDYLATLAAGDGPARRQGHLDAARLPPGHVARDLRRRGRARLGGEPAGAVQPAPADQAAVPDGLLDAGALDRLRPVLGEQERSARRLGRSLGRRSRSGGATSPTRWATTSSTSRGRAGSGGPA